jgi:hypothetical protein
MWLIGICALAGGCAAQGPPIGVWFGPQATSQFTITQQPEDPSARLVETAHYDIYTTIGDDALLTRIAQLMEGSFAAYQVMAPDALPTQTRMRCWVFAKRSQWAEFTREHTGANAILYLQINRGAYTLGDWYVAYDIGETSTLSVAAHEGWHQFVFRHFHARLPPFLEEGLATMYEGVKFKDGLPRFNLSLNQNRAIQLRSAIEGNSLWPLGQVVGMNAGEVVGHPGDKIDAFYSQAWGLGRFLWDADQGKYRPALQKILADTADGTIYDATGPHHDKRRNWTAPGVKSMLEHYLGMDWQQIDDAYTQFIHHVAYDELPNESDEPS